MVKQEEPTATLSPSLSLKRKRPPVLEIPNVLCQISTDVAENSTSSFGGPGVGVFSRKGKIKRLMEDTYEAVPSFNCSSNQIKGFFGVYDGHGGREAADFVANNLHTNIIEMLKTRSREETKEEAVQAGYIKTDNEFLKQVYQHFSPLKLSMSTEETKEEAVQAGYLTTDNEFLKQGVNGGACCVTAFIEGDNIIISNLGDCRAVLCRGSVAEAVTTDHRADNDVEQKRIETKGGYVEMHRGAWRVHGVLSVSRSIGDAHLKEWVTAEPDTKIFPLSQDMNYLILASDGLWEKVDNQEAVDIVTGLIRNRKKTEFINHEKNVNSGFVPKLQKSPLINRKKKMGLSSIRRRIIRRNENHDEFPCENEGPPLKIRRVLAQYEDQEHNGDGNIIISRSSVLVSACNELVNLALSRGSLDDITVMIINLKHFK